MVGRNFLDSLIPGARILDVLPHFNIQEQVTENSFHLYGPRSEFLIIIFVEGKNLYAIYILKIEEKGLNFLCFQEQLVSLIFKRKCKQTNKFYKLINV